MNNRNYKRIKAGLISVILIGSISALVVPLSGETNWMERFRFFEYTSTNFQFRIEIAECDAGAAGTITVNEIYTQGNITINNTHIYDLDTRKIIYPGWSAICPEWSDYYAWTWINEDDIQNGTVYAADKELYLFDTTPEFYIFNYSEASGSNGLVYYDKYRLTLVKTEDNIVIDNDTIENSLMYSTEGYDYSIVAHFEEPVDISVPLNITGEELILEYIESGGVQLFNPPYNNAWGDKYKKKDFIAQVDADWAGSKTDGWVWGMGKTFAGMILGRAIAQAWGWLRGPGGIGKFSVSQDGNYEIHMNFIMNGVAETIASFPPSWWGAGLAYGDIDLTGSVYEYGTNYLVKDRTIKLYDAAAPIVPINLGYWDDQLHQIKLKGFLFADKHYYFQGELYQEHRSGAIGFAVGGSESDMEALLLVVMVKKD